MVPRPDQPEEQSKQTLPRSWRGSFISGFGFAFEGIFYTLRTQRNMLVHVGVGLIAVGVGLWLGLSTGEWAALLVVMALVYCLEMLNTVVEAVVDLVTEHQYHPLAKVAKDVAAGSGAGSRYLCGAGRFSVVFAASLADTYPFIGCLKMTDRPLKVLLLTPQTPFPPDQGAAIRNYSFVRYLGENPAYELTLLSFARPQEDPTTTEARTELEKYCQKVVLVTHPPARSKVRRLRDMVLSRQPDLAHRLASTEFDAVLTQLVAEVEPDVIQCEGLEMVPFVLKLKLGIDVRLILDEHNAEYLLQRRIFEQDWLTGGRRRLVGLYSLIQCRRLRIYEKKALKKFQPIAVSEPDREALLDLRPYLDSLPVIPNGLDLEAFSYDADQSEENPDQLVFTGTMDFRPNVDAVTWFAHEVWPLIQEVRPEATFVIVGRRPAPAVMALAQLEGIEVTGTVPDARPYIRQSAVYVVPMRMGGGVRFKVLEALALGKPVVTTAMGADGINLVAGQHALLADDPVEFAQAVLRLLNHPARRTALAEQGRQFVETYFDWRKITPALDAVLHDTMDDSSDSADSNNPDDSTDSTKSLS